jgi:hypothetical protein
LIPETKKEWLLPARRNLWWAGLISGLTLVLLIGYIVTNPQLRNTGVWLILSGLPISVVIYLIRAWRLARSSAKNVSLYNRLPLDKLLFRPWLNGLLSFIMFLLMFASISEFSNWVRGNPNPSIDFYCNLLFFVIPALVFVCILFKRRRVNTKLRRILRKN